MLVGVCGRRCWLVLCVVVFPCVCLVVGWCRLLLVRVGICCYCCMLLVVICLCPLLHVRKVRCFVVCSGLFVGVCGSGGGVRCSFLFRRCLLLYVTCCWLVVVDCCSVLFGVACCRIMWSLRVVVFWFVVRCLLFVVRCVLLFVDICCCALVSLLGVRCLLSVIIVV